MAGQNSLGTTALATVAAARICVGVAMILVPGRFFKQASGTETLLMRTIGIRDVVIGTGACAALGASGGGEFRRWASMGLLSDSADVIAGLTSSRSLPDTRSALIAMLSPVPFVAAGIFGLARGAKQI
jgi:hypothetical protein